MTTVDTALNELRQSVGSERLSIDPQHRQTYSEDIAGPTPDTFLAVVSPETAGQVASVIAIARKAGLAVHPRGGGMSYTGGYVAGSDRSIALDLTGLEQVIEIDCDARFVIVEAGCTWSELYQSLADQGMRTPFFGPLSGIAATVGGSLSQNGAFFGSAAHGYAADHVLGLEIADGTGELHRLGSWAAGRHTALPWHGPGVLKAFLGDCGALGIKTKAVLPIHPVPPTTVFASFAFDDDETLLRAMAGLRDLPHVSELWAFDREAHRTLAATGFSVLETAQMAAEVAGGSSSLLGAAKNLVQASVMRRAVLTDIDWSLHMVIEPPLTNMASPILEAVRARIEEIGGREIPDTIPRVTRARPFRPIRALIGPDGERWLPCHGVFPATVAPKGMAALRALLRERMQEMEAQGVRVTLLIAAVGNELLIEPQLFWADSLSGFQTAHSPPAQVKMHRDAPARSKARALAFELRHAMTEAMAQAGAGHLQLGRYYGYRQELEAGPRGALDALKAQMDPDGILNPGVLGFPPALSRPAR